MEAHYNFELFVLNTRNLQPCKLKYLVRDLIVNETYYLPNYKPLTTICSRLNKNKPYMERMNFKISL